MINPFPFRALSPHHATAMDLDYLMKVLDAAEAYGFNALQICGDTHGAGNLDGVTVFERFPKANDVQEMDGVRRRREILRTVCRAAHDRGMEVYYWHHELWFPQRLPEVYPDWFAAAPKNRFTRDLYTDRVPRIEPGAPIWDFMDAKFDEAFAQIPELDGTVMTIQESRVPVYCLFEDFEQQVEALVDQYRRLEAAHRRAGRKWIIRTFAWREHEYRVVTEAIRRWRPGVPVESKGVPMDWDLYYPYDPLLGEFEGMTKHVEIAPSCEFYGCTTHPVGHPWLYTSNLAFAGERGHTGAAVRMDRAGTTMLGGPDEGVLACIGAWLNDPAGTDVGEVYVQWMMERYGVDRPTGRRMVFEMMEHCWQATLHAYHQGKIYIGDSFWQRYDHQFFVAERHFCVEHDEPEPLAEKDLACRHAAQAADILAEIAPSLKPDDAEDLARRIRFLQHTCRSWRALVAALVGRGRQMYEPSEAHFTALRQAIDELEAAGAATSEAFPELNQPGTSGNAPRQRQPGVLVEEFARAFRADLPRLPARTIVDRLSADELGANDEQDGRAAWHPPGEGRTITLRGRGGANHVLVLFAGTEMCVRRPVVIRGRGWEHRFDVGQYAWFLAHDRLRRYETPVPASCIDADGVCTLELTVPEPDRSPRIAEIRLEVETIGF